MFLLLQLRDLVCARLPVRSERRSNVAPSVDATRAILRIDLLVPLLRQLNLVLGPLQSKLPLRADLLLTLLKNVVSVEGQVEMVPR